MHPESLMLASKELIDSGLMVYVRIGPLPKKYRQSVTVSLNKLVLHSLLRVVATVFLKHCFSNEVVLDWVIVKTISPVKQYPAHVVVEEENGDSRCLVI